MGRERGLRRALRRTARFLPLLFPEYALGGRVAANFYAPPRATVDVDFLVYLREDAVARLIEYAVSKGWEVTPGELGHRHYRVYAGGLRFDLLDPGRAVFDDTVVKRRRAFPISKGISLMILAPEDLVLLYTFSSQAPGREARDLLSAYEVAFYSTIRGDFNWDYAVARACRSGGELCGKVALLRRRVLSGASPPHTQGRQVGDRLL